MKVTIPEIAWHNRDPVFSADFSMGEGCQWRMATAGADSDVKMWRVVPHRDGKDAEVTFLSNLRRHTNTVNCVRFSPDGLLLASGGDDGAMFLWQEKEDKNVEGNLFEEDSEQNKEHWVAYKMLRGHIEDIMDIAWSPDGKMIVSGSIDNSVIVWEAKTGKKLHLLKEHSHYVQGVTWDPLGEFICSLSSDRSLLVYEAARGNLMYNVSKHRREKKQVEKDADDKEKTEKIEKEKTNRLFVEEGATKYFRRLDFTPDGAFLITPAGQVSTADDLCHVTYMFSRSNLKKPICHLPGPQKPVCAVRCCPVLYEYQNKETKKHTNLPYRMIYAVASLSEVYLYDTEQFTPFCSVSDIHYACITDLAWSSNGRVLMITSYDGFCTVLSFDQDELGTPYSSQPAQINSPRLLLRPETKSKKKKKSSPKNSEKKNSGVENKDPNSVQTTVTADSCVVAMEVKEGKDLPANEPCVTPKRQNGISTAPKELLNNNHVTPVREKELLNNNHVTPVRESESVVKRITPIKVSEVQKSREMKPEGVVEVMVSENTDNINNKPVSKPPRRLALTKIE
ncbi:chromatin assembly factor 1 subunit B-like [Bolinopsis microptera]|uniref:chromatin assembly factor 1 subunit B-like n=1 Tax=Bolinopsis microptera TaxID=2820187 RepID=UPI003079AEDA